MILFQTFLSLNAKIKYILQQDLFGEKNLLKYKLLMDVLLNDPTEGTSLLTNQINSPIERLSFSS
jgi:hypothetical protein